MFEKFVKSITDKMILKNDLNIGDLALIFLENNVAFVVITDIKKNPRPKVAWWDVTFKLLTIPLQEISWTLRHEQMTGQEHFTINGENRFFAPIDVGQSIPSTPTPPKPKLTSNNNDIVRTPRRGNLKLVK